jgi:hypothetical protein
MDKGKGYTKSANDLFSNQRGFKRACLFHIDSEFAGKTAFNVCLVYLANIKLSHDYYYFF